MSLFDGISNVQRPDVKMNEGPLPTSGPPYFPSARINYASDLLGDHIEPYSYGKAANVSDQTSYLNLAHRIQKIVPQLSLPNASSEGTFQLSHAVDIGDIGFVLRIDRRGSVVPNITSFDRLQLTRMVDPIVNIVTVNYILAGLQRFWNQREAVNWQQLMADLRFVEDAYAEKGPFTVGDALRFISDTGTARPFGVPHTSELQGGQHEGGNGPVTYPVNFISTFFISGLTKNICNIWSQSNISAGDDLIFKLEKLPIASKDGSIKYHLNHWKKSTVIQQFRYEEGGINEAWQVVPAILSTYTPPRSLENYDYRENGYWHICRSQLMFRNETDPSRRYDAPCSAVYHDDRASMRGSLIEATFEPVWIEYTPWAPARGVKRTNGVGSGKVSRFGWSKSGDGGGGGGGESGGGGFEDPDGGDEEDFDEKEIEQVVKGVVDRALLGGAAKARAQQSKRRGRGGRLPPPRRIGLEFSATESSQIESDTGIDIAMNIDNTPTIAPSDSVAESTKKPRRTLGLAVGLGKEASVMVQSVGKTS